MTTMKRITIAVMAAALCAAAAFGQSLSDNSFYRRSLELQAMAQAAFDEGDYDTAADYAAQAQENALLSDEYVAKMLAMKAADEALASAQARYDWAMGVRAEIRYPAAFADAGSALAWARSDYDAEAFVDAKAKADEVVALLTMVTDESPLPAFFVVRELSSLEDCYWRIAALPSVYNDPWKWTVLYKANKKAMVDPSNPDLIKPGMVIAIPSIAGELRDGTWSEDGKYPTFQAPN